MDREVRERDKEVAGRERERWGGGQRKEREVGEKEGRR